MAAPLQTDELVTKLSPWSVEESVARLSALVAAKGIKLFATIDHSGEAAAAGLKLRYATPRSSFSGTQRREPR